MIKYISVQQDDDKLLGIRSMGYESNGSLAHWGPGVRNYFILHYVFEGKGYFNGSPVTKGNGFLICPNKLHRKKEYLRNSIEIRLTIKII